MYSSNVKDRESLRSRAMEKTIHKKEEDEDEEELEMQSLPKGLANFDYGEELDFKIQPMRSPNSQGGPQSENLVNSNSGRNHLENHKQQVQTIMERLKDSKALVEVFENYQTKNKDLSITDIKSSTKTKIKRYKDCVYFGEIINSKRHGKGIMVYADTRIYEGEWENDLKHGTGLEILSNGNKYEGHFLNGKPEGVGTFTWTNGEIYEGEWKNGLKHGSGMWRGIKGESYIGEWKNGKADGYGVHTWRNGDRYEGELKGFLKHGQGTEKFFNGDFYVGSYVNGKPDGYGEYNWANGCQYKGQFKNGLRHGKGMWKKTGDNSDVYEGEWINDKKCGSGTYLWSSGNRYEGDYFDDMRHGYGEMYWNDGSYYKGAWERGIQHGEGELMIPDKALQKGLFSNNEFVGEIDGDAKLESLPRPKPNKGRFESLPQLPGQDIELPRNMVYSVKNNERVSQRSHSQVGGVRRASPGHAQSVERNNQSRDSSLNGRAVYKNGNLKVSMDARPKKEYQEFVNPEVQNQVKKISHPPIWKPAGKYKTEK